MYSIKLFITYEVFIIKVDIWSVGVILFEALFGRAPYSSQTVEELINKIKELHPHFIFTMVMNYV